MGDRAGVIRFCCTFPPGSGNRAGKLGIISINPDMDEDFVICKTMFEHSRRPGNVLEHFDPKIHTLEAIARGLPRHFPMTCRRISEADLPERNGRVEFWEDTGTEIRIKRA